MNDVAAPLSASNQRTMLDAGRVWWFFLVTGSLWLLFSIIVLLFDYTSVSAISILFGILMLGFWLIELVCGTALPTAGVVAPPRPCARVLRDRARQRSSILLIRSRRWRR